MSLLPLTYRHRGPRPAPGRTGAEAAARRSRPHRDLSPRPPRSQWPLREPGSRRAAPGLAGREPRQPRSGGGGGRGPLRAGCQRRHSRCSVRGGSGSAHRCAMEAQAQDSSQCFPELSCTASPSMEKEPASKTIGGLLETQSLHEADEDMGTDVDFTSMISEEEKEELKTELAKLEDEISTLRQVLAAKEKHLVEIKQKLGISLMNELKQNFSKSWHDMQTTSAYKKTHETLSHAGQKATAAISNVGTAISKKFGDMSYSIRHSISMPAMRNSPTFKSFEEKVETTVTNLKTKVGGTGHAGGSFEDVLSSTAHASAQSSLAGTQLPENEEELQC
ncbi:tumor protein D53 isoform X2 [Dromaius novaehollandiae]|uniref:tumor protein D53 isoform X2 n=1 Tax=Dromaius novaehollandiae TaxID=8790 RepID=UPI00311D9AEB